MNINCDCCVSVLLGDNKNMIGICHIQNVYLSITLLLFLFDYLHTISSVI